MDDYKPRDPDKPEPTPEDWKAIGEDFRTVGDALLRSIEALKKQIEAEKADPDSDWNRNAVDHMQPGEEPEPLLDRVLKALLRWRKR